MASSFPSCPVYDHECKQFTGVGLHYLRFVFAGNPHPNSNELRDLQKQFGCEMKKIMDAFRDMRKYDKKKQKKEGLEKNANQPDVTSDEITPTEADQLSIPVQLLNIISRNQARQLVKKIKTSHDYQMLINPRCIDDEITVEELGLLSSVTSEDGKFFKDWISCLVMPANLEASSKAYPRTDICAGTVTFPFLQPELDEFLSNNNINNSKVLNHHVVLRTKLSKPLPALSTACGSNTASHLCDIMGCIRKNHLVLESFKTNNSRRGCPGVTLILRSQGPSTPKKIMEIHPCAHGINRPGVNGNLLTFNCRKISVMIQDPASIDFFKSLA